MKYTICIYYTDGTDTHMHHDTWIDAITAMCNLSPDNILLENAIEWELHYVRTRLALRF